MRLHIPRNVHRVDMLAGSLSKKQGWKGTMENPMGLDVLPLGMG